MTKYSRRSKADGTVISLVFLALLASTYHKELIDVLYIGIGIIALLLLIQLFRKVHIYKRNIDLADIDSMDGLEFEQYIAKVLKDHGFSRVRLTEKYDLGVDITAEKNGERWGVQVKRYSGLVKAEAVRQVVTALNTYNCDRSMVITNSRYSKVAQQLASSNDCILVDRPKLIKLIEQAD